MEILALPSPPIAPAIGNPWRTSCLWRQIQRSHWSTGVIPLDPLTSVSSIFPYDLLDNYYLPNHNIRTYLPTILLHNDFLHSPLSRSLIPQNKQQHSYFPKQPNTVKMIPRLSQLFRSTHSHTNTRSLSNTSAFLHRQRQHIFKLRF